MLQYILSVIQYMAVPSESNIQISVILKVCENQR